MTIPYDFLEYGEGDSIALVLDEREYTRAELRARVLAVRRGLASLVLRPGAIISWIGLTSIEAIVCELAVTSMDLVWSPLGARLTPRELGERFAQLQPAVVLHDTPSGGRSRIGERVAEALDSCGFSGLEVLIGPTDSGFTFSSLLDIGDAIRRDPAFVRDRAVNRIQFTSGTSASPKAVGLSSEALMANAQTMAAAMRLGVEDCFFNPLPLDHAAGYATLLTMLFAGGSSVMQPFFEPARALELMRAHKCTAFRGVDAVYLDLVRLAGGAPPRLRTGILSTTNPSVRRRVQEAFGLEEAIQLYGMSESSGPATIGLIGESAEERFETHGRPVDGTEVWIASPDAEGIGEIHLRGSRLMTGYVGNPAATAAACFGGWFATGDRGQLVGEHLRYLGRIKDLIKVGGENVACAEVEAVLIDCPGVADAAAFPIPDERLGEVVGVAVVPSDVEQLTPEVVQAHMAEHLARFKQPHRVLILDELPRTSSGKLKRRDLVTHLGEVPVAAGVDKGESDTDMGDQQ